MGSYSTFCSSYAHHGWYNIPQSVGPVKSYVFFLYDSMISNERMDEGEGHSSLLEAIK